MAKNKYSGKLLATAPVTIKRLERYHKMHQKHVRVIKPFSACSRNNGQTEML